jgi:hypothetical protein
MKIENKFDIGQIVYLKTDEDQKPRMVTELKISANRGIMYALSAGASDTYHYAIEISETKNIIELLTGKDESGNEN